MRLLRRVSRLVRAAFGRDVSPPQLELALPAGCAEVALGHVPNGYKLRTLSAGDEPRLLSLLQRSGFDQFDRAALADALAICLPAGCFVVEHQTTGALVSTMMARHLSSPAHPFGGRIDWLATDPAHRGKGLAAVCARNATRRLQTAGYSEIYVTTDDHRLGALRVFIDIGFRPVAHPGTEQRWQAVFAALDYDPSLQKVPAAKLFDPSLHKIPSN